MGRMTNPECRLMSWRISLSKYCLLFALALSCTVSLAREEVQVGELSYLDRQYMSQQRAMLDELSAKHFGRRFTGDTDRDIELLQVLLDRELVRPGQTQELQAMGVIMGDLLAKDLDLHWVIYQDQLGRSRALRDGETDNYLFPITMISRRREVDNRTAVAEIYRKASNIIMQNRPPAPFK
jgi:hypothetical protein